MSRKYFVEAEPMELELPPPLPVPTENRDSVAVRAEVSSKLVPVKPIDGALLLGGTDAEPIVMEYTPQVPGQQSFDPSVDTEPKVVKLA